MPFGMGRAGWFMWQHPALWGTYGYPWFQHPYWPFSPYLSRAEEEQLLQGQARMLENQLAQIQKRLEELKTEDKEKNETKT
jgi:hypothetical protein